MVPLFMRMPRIAGVAAIGGLLMLFAQAGAAAATELPQPPEVVSVNGVASLTLTAVQNPKTNLPAFMFQGGFTPPTIRVNPGDHIRILYVNKLPVPENAGFMNMTNLHTHGLKTAPVPPGDDVLDILLAPGQKYQYDFAVPKDESPGLYWYHSHPHGESNRQLAGGMSGLIVVNGIEKYYPQTARVPERLLIFRDSYPAGVIFPDLRYSRYARHTIMRAADTLRTQRPQLSFAQAVSIVEQDPSRLSAAAAAPPPPYCTGTATKDISLNGVDRPTISIRPGERQFWRFANASSDSFVDIQVDGAQLYIIARDGEPIYYRDRHAAGVVASHYLLGPGNRLEFFVTGPAIPNAEFRTLCVNTGPAGDTVPERVLADLNPARSGGEALIPGPANLAVTHKPLTDIRLLPVAATKKIVFTENNQIGLFYINGDLFDPSKPAKYFARAGTVEEWTIVNATQELHIFHIHQLHFVSLDSIAQNPSAPLVFLDSITVPFGKPGPDGKLVPGVVHLLMDFTDPIIRGTFVFHCHLLEHEDFGMMQKITVR
jgi:FtsP/CotA-like multicopper oxidase with cupredoxin domain